MGSVVSLLWPKNEAALQHYLTKVPSQVLTAASLFASVPGESVSALAADAKQRVNRLNDAPAQIEERLHQSLVLVEALDRAHAQNPVELVVLNEDVMQHSKTAALWAKSRGVPSVVVSHSSILGRLYTVHREDNGGTLAVFGRMGAVPHTDMGMPAERVAITGNPAWDVYAVLAERRSAVRSEMFARNAFSANDHVVVFATTWPAFFTAFCDAGHYEKSLRAAVRAVRELRDLDVPVQLVIKERSSNAEKGAEREAILREEAAGFTPVVTDRDLESWIVAADAVVSVDSNIAVEAMIAGTPAINIWSPMSWLNGPYFGAEDGVMDVRPDDLAVALARVLGDPGVREQLTSQARARYPEFASFVGSAAVRTADLLMQTRKPAAASRYVWQELSDPRGVSEKGRDSVYYRSPRSDMIARLRRAPRVMLDIGCGAGATGAEIKRLHPTAHVTGIEMNEQAAALAQGRIDRIVVDNVETLDFEQAGIKSGSVDVVFFPDVLEHLYDPWRLLVRLKAFLTPDAQVLASVPNVRNLWLLAQLGAGSWQYEEEGLLDVTHIRFFTKKTVIELFEQTGYRVGALYANGDGRVPEINVPSGATVNVDLPQMTLKNVSEQDAVELRTLQFIVDATPGA
ncbi:MAG: methyltransferase domain-containing protein [Candidatus Baltobacteraceae bacterium]